MQMKFRPVFFLISRFCKHDLAKNFRAIKTRLALGLGRIGALSSVWSTKMIALERFSVQKWRVVKKQSHAGAQGSGSV